MVEALKENLIREQAVVEEKKVATDALIVLIGKETAVAEEQKESSRADEEKCSAIATEVTEFKEVCERDMAAAVPIIEAAIAALNSLDKASLTELKAFASPAKAVVDVMGALMVITGKGKIPSDRSWNQGKKLMTLVDILSLPLLPLSVPLLPLSVPLLTLYVSLLTLSPGKKLMGNVDKLLSDLKGFDKDNSPENAVKFIEDNYMSDPDFDTKVVTGKSKAAGGLCDWIINICKYFRIYQVVAPKKAKLEEAAAKLDAANAKLKVVRDIVAAIEAKCATLKQQFDEASEDKANAIATAEKTQLRARMADRLVAGLADEKVPSSRLSVPLSRVSVPSSGLCVLLSRLSIPLSG